jgi:hypothetical protein
MQVESALFFETPEQIFTRVYESVRPRSPRLPVRVEFRKYAGANSFIRLQAGEILVRMPDLLEGAPAPIVEALAHILLCKLFRKPVPAVYSHRYKLYLNRRDVRTNVHLLRQTRGRKFISGPEGGAYNLEEIFDHINEKHFDGLIERPMLGWSRRPSRSTLGHYDPSHNAIILSKLLDSPQVPRMAVEYVMFHEMLHLKHPVEHHGARRCVHTREFRQAEKDFEGLKEAKELLKKL